MASVITFNKAGVGTLLNGMSKAEIKKIPRALRKESNKKAFLWLFRNQNTYPGASTANYASPRDPGGYTVADFEAYFEGLNTTVTTDIRSALTLQSNHRTIFNTFNKGTRNANINIA